MNDKSVAEVVMLIIAAYDEELTIMRRERDEAKSAARQAEANARHWQSNHADQVARCALLRERPDLPVDRIPAYKELVRLQQAQAQQGEAKTPAPLFDRKLADLEQRGYAVIGRILHKDGQYALFDSSCRWLTKPQYQRLMHEQDGSLFSAPAVAEGWRDLTQDEVRKIYRMWGHCQETPMALFKRFKDAASAPAPEGQP
jgi:hypothetical protein